MIPFKDCFTADVTKDIVALHETGHVIAMYALGMMDHFSYVTKQAGDGTLGLTDVTPEYKATLAQFSNDIIQAVASQHTGKDCANIIQLSRLDAAKHYLPNLFRLFGGGSICRYYHIPDEAMCAIDYREIDTMLAGLGLPGTRETILPLVDQYLNAVFASFDLLTKAIYQNLVHYKTLDKEQVMQIIQEWEAYRLL